MEDIINNINSLQTEFEATLCNLEQKIKELKIQANVYQALHTGCALDQQLDNRFTWCSIKQLSQTTETREDLPTLHIIKEDEEVNQEEEQIIVTAGTDGSVMTRRGRKVAAAAVYFADGSPLNSSKAVLNSASSMCPEVEAFIELLHTAKRENIKKIAAIIDNSAAISFIESSTKKTILTSRVLQEYMLHNPALERKANIIRELALSFSTILIRWQRSHTNETSVFARLNRGADTAAKQRADEILQVILK